MQLISAHDGKLLRLNGTNVRDGAQNGFATGLPLLDALLPDQKFARGAVHELLTEPGNGLASFFAMVIARAATGQKAGEKVQSAKCRVQNANAPALSQFSISNFQFSISNFSPPSTGFTESPAADVKLRITPSAPAEADPTESQEQLKISNFKFQIEKRTQERSPQFDFCNFQFSIFNSSSLIWSDPTHQLYPPALAAHGIPPDRLLLLRPRDLEEQTWAIAECLRCRGVGAVVAAPGALSRIEARRLQLAAEQGGGVGLLLRTTRDATHYAAATRWLVRSARGQRTVQRWNIQLLHGHGGRIGQTVCLE